MFTLFWKSVLINKRSRWTMFSVQWAVQLSFLSCLLWQFWHCFQHFLASRVSPCLFLSLGLSLKCTPFGSVFHSGLHSSCSFFYTWNPPSCFLHSGACQVLLTLFFHSTALFWVVLHFFWSLCIIAPSPVVPQPFSQFLMLNLIYAPCFYSVPDNK